MESILTELYHGNYSGVDAPSDKNGKYSKALSRATALEDNLRAALPTVLTPQFNRFVKAFADAFMAYGEKDFIEGVRLGVRIMLTALPVNTSEGETTVKKNDQIRALVNAFTDLADNVCHSERATMEALLDIFDPEELSELGYADRVKAYLKEYGCDEDDEDNTLEALKRKILPEVNRRLSELFPSYQQSLPKSFINGIIEDVYDSSDWQTTGQYSGEDISLAIQRHILQSIKFRTA